MAVGVSLQSSPILQRFVQAGSSTRVMRTYIVHSWTDDSALPWASREIEAGDAIIWRELGFLAAQAETVIGEGSSLVDVLRGWWNSGTAIGNVGLMIGAGIGPAEARDKENGLLLEKAEVMRVLRSNS